MSWWSWFKIVRWLLVASALPFLPPVLAVVVGACLCAVILSEFVEIT